MARKLSDYNRFTKRFFEDNPGATIEDAAAAWRAKKSSASPATKGGTGASLSDKGQTPRFSRSDIGGSG